MFYANDTSGKRVFIDNAIVKGEYFCPTCGATLIIRKGNKRVHHFAHKRSKECTDSWHYDMTDWHYDWQLRFPEECREVVMEKDGIKHRADVFFDNNVIEFQHSPLSPNEFEERNNFYTSLGYKVIWIFDLGEEYDDEKIRESNRKRNLYSWTRPRNTFNSFNPKNTNVTLYFQFGGWDDNDDEPWLLKVTWRGDNGFERFAVDKKQYSKDNFVDQSSIRPKTYFKEEIYNDLDANKVGNCGHGSIFIGCPISKTGLASNNEIDIIPEGYGECVKCPHFLDYNCCRYAADYMKIPDDADIVEIKRDKKFNLVYEVTYKVDGEEHTGKIPFKKYEYQSIIQIWKSFKNVKSIICKNVTKDMYVIILEDPEAKYKKYRNVYGKISKDQYGPYTKDTLKIYGATDPVWVCIKHNY